jgi:hypothetical protein
VFFSEGAAEGGNSRNVLTSIRLSRSVPFLQIAIELLKLSTSQYTKPYFNSVFYGCETWALILREDMKLKVFANRALRKKFGPRKEEVTGEWG